MSGKENSPGWAEFLNTPYSDTLMLSEKEQLVLDLFNQEEEMRLQRCLLEAQQSGESTRAVGYGHVSVVNRQQSLMRT